MTATKTKKQTQANKRLLLEQIELNEGQLNGLPSNPRFIKRRKVCILGEINTRQPRIFESSSFACLSDEERQVYNNSRKYALTSLPRNRNEGRSVLHFPEINERKKVTRVHSKG